MEEWLRKRLVSAEEKYRNDPVNMITALNDIGNEYGKLGDHEKKKELLKEALKIAEAHYGLNHLKVAHILKDLGCAYYGDSQHTQQKIQLLKQALKIEERNHGTNHVKLITSLINLGNAYGELGYHKEDKKEMLKRAVRIVDNNGVETSRVIDTILRYLVSNNHVEIFIILHNLANADGELGYHDEEKKEMLKRALRIADNNGVETSKVIDTILPDLGSNNHVEIFTILHNLGNVYGELGNNAGKTEMLRKALDLAERFPKVIDLLCDLEVACREPEGTENLKETLERALVLAEIRSFMFSKFLDLLDHLEDACREPEGQEKLEWSSERALYVALRYFFRFSKVFNLPYDIRWEPERRLELGELGNPEEMKRMLKRALDLAKGHFLTFAKYYCRLRCVYRQRVYKVEIKMLEKALRLAERHCSELPILLDILRVLGHFDRKRIDNKWINTNVPERVHDFAKRRYIDITAVLDKLRDLERTYSRLGHLEMAGKISKITRLFEEIDKRKNFMIKRELRLSRYITRRNFMVPSISQLLNYCVTLEMFMVIWNILRERMSCIRKLWQLRTENKLYLH